MVGAQEAYVCLPLTLLLFTGMLTTHYSLLTTHYLLLTTHYYLLTNHYLQPRWALGVLTHEFLVGVAPFSDPGGK